MRKSMEFSATAFCIWPRGTSVGNRACLDGVSNAASVEFTNPMT